MQRIIQLSKDFAATDDDVQRAKYVKIIDEDRDAIIENLNEIWTSKELKLNEMRIPTTVDLYGELYNSPTEDTTQSS